MCHSHKNHGVLDLIKFHWFSCLKTVYSLFQLLPTHIHACTHALILSYFSFVTHNFHRYLTQCRTLAVIPPTRLYILIYNNKYFLAAAKPRGVFAHVSCVSLVVSVKHQTSDVTIEGSPVTSALIYLVNQMAWSNVWHHGETCNFSYTAVCGCWNLSNITNNFYIYNQLETLGEQ